LIDLLLAAATAAWPAPPIVSPPALPPRVPLVAPFVQEGDPDPQEDPDKPRPGRKRRKKESDPADEATPGWAMPDWPGIQFKEVAKESGIDVTNRSGEPEKPRLIDTLGSGMCWFDHDGDGWLDLFVANGGTLEAVLGTTVKVKRPDGTEEEVPARNEVSDRLFRNLGDGTFEDVTERSGLKDDRWGISAVAGDYDNDGDSDLYVCNIGPNCLYRNNGDGTFTDVAKGTDLEFDHVTPGAAFGDVDGDGDLDLYVSAYLQFNRKRPWPSFAKVMRGMRVMLGPQGLQGATDKLFRNDGNDRFTDVTKEAGLRTSEEDYGFTIFIVDLNEDDLVDIFVADDMTVNQHYRQVKPGRFTPCGAESGLAVDAAGEQKACMGVALGDVNDDLIPDFFITNFSAQTNDFYLSAGDNLWIENPRYTERARTAMPYVGWGTGWFDLDLDGDEDLIAFNGHVFPQVETERPRVQDYYQYPLLYRRDGKLKFTDAAKEAGTDFYAQRSCRGAGFADYDDDGDVDIALFQMDMPALLLRNDTERRGHFVRVQLIGTNVNRDGYGSRVVVEAGGRRHARWNLGHGSFISHNDIRSHVGLGETAVVDRITVRWTGGFEEVIEGPIAVDRTIVIKEGMGIVAQLTGEPDPGDPEKKRTPQLLPRKVADELHAAAIEKGIAKPRAEAAAGGPAGEAAAPPANGGGE
jgi:hypothetical protein